MLQVPAGIERPPYADTGVAPSFHPPPQIHDAAGMQRMREAGKMARDLLAYACELVKPDLTTDDIDRLVHEYAVTKLKVYPSTLNYGGFPKSLCTSINEIVCHGIPDTEANIVAGDLLKLDVSCYLNGVHGDTCRTVIAGGPEATDEAGRRLFSTTKRALDGAIKLCGPGVPIREIGSFIHSLLDSEGFESVREYSGHGIGSLFHTHPLVKHFRNEERDIMRPGMTFTIEPMIVEGSARVRMWPDGWTIVTADGKRCAQFEHTILITEHGAEVLTAYE